MSPSSPLAVSPSSIFPTRVSTFLIQHRKKHLEIPTSRVVWSQGFTEWHSMTNDAKDRVFAAVKQIRAGREKTACQKEARRCPLPDICIHAADPND